MINLNSIGIDSTVSARQSAAGFFDPEKVLPSGSQEFLARCRKYVRDNPKLSVFAAACTGVILGCLIKRR